MKLRVLALDLERTLVDNAFSGHPRPGLRSFLTFCQERFERVALFTTVDEADAREVLTELHRIGKFPPGLFDRLEFVNWCGEYKDLAFISGAMSDKIVLIDDDAGWIRPDQRARWIPISPWDGGPDDELARVRMVLESWLVGGSGAPDML